MKYGFARLAALAAFSFICGGTAHAQVVISQVYGGGGNSGAPLRSDFVELHNNGASAVSLAGWSVQYASSTGVNWQVTPLSGSIAPGAYYLVKQADGANTSAPSLPTPDATGTTLLAAGTGKVALSNGTTALSGACPTGNIDFVGFGTAANCAEGSAPTATINATTAALRANGGCTDSNNNGADFGTGAPNPRNSASTANVCGGGGQPSLSATDLSQDEASGSFTFALALSQPAAAGGVSVDYATDDGTAQAGSDYTSASGTATFAEGEQSVQVTITVADDGATENNETFFLNLSNVTGALLGDAQAQATIVNDDVTLTAIHDIQGNGATSPYANQLVFTTGIVTGRKGNGFFLQASDAEADVDPATSEGVFVFTGAAPPVEAAVGNRVRVGGTLIEFVPPADPQQLPLTEIGGGPSVSLLSTGHALPSPIPLTAAMTDPAGGVGQLEALEGMRVTGSLTTIAGSDGFKTPYNATGGINGIIQAVITGVARPFREAGIPLLDTIPGGGTSPPIPRWDSNPEIVTIDSDTLARNAGGLDGNAYVLDLPAGSLIEGLTGPLDYGFHRYTVHRDPAVAINVSSPETRAARVPGAREFTVAAYNMERFYDTVEDPAVDDDHANATAYATRLQKASLGIRDYLHSPDIVTAIEIENLGVLQALATKVNADAVTAGQRDPQYVAYLLEGHDIGGIDIGFLVKTAPVASGLPRIEALSVAQPDTDPFFEPGRYLNDRPPLFLNAIVHYDDGRAYPITVVGVHQRSLNDVELDNASGARARLKRLQQAEFLAGKIQAIQAASPDTRVVVLGDFNAFAFNDGMGDIMGVTSGTPVADEQTVVPGDGIDLVDPDMINLGELAPAAERYSYVFDGNAQTLDHVLVNEELIVTTRAASIDHARINADFTDTQRSDAGTATRMADHDPVIAYFDPRAVADLFVTAHANSSSVAPGQVLSFSASVGNLGPNAADHPGIGFALNAELPSLVVNAPAGWNCDAPQINAGMTSVACVADTLANGASADFSLTVTATAAQAGNAVNLAVASSAQSLDPAEDNDQATASIEVIDHADLSVQLSGPGKKLHYGRIEPFRLTLRNAGPDAARLPVVRLRGDAPAANVAIAAPTGWQCAVSNDAGGFVAQCTSADAFAAAASRRFDFAIRIPARSNSTQTLSLEAAASTATSDTDAANDTASYVNRIVGVP